MKIVLDASGGDSPVENIKGAVAAVMENKDISIYLVGKESSVLEELLKLEYDKERIKIINASEIITNNEHPVSAIREKKDSSIVVGLELVKNNACDGFVSMGSTGAVLIGASLIVGRVKGVERPAIATAIPTLKGKSFMLDCGANVDPKPSHLLQFAKMGSVYVEKVFGRSNPTVGLANIGAEKEKGDALRRETYPLLENSGLNFIGNIEPRDIPFGVADVVVTDAFTGNVILKHTEGLSSALFAMIKREIKRKPLYALGGALAKGAFKEIKKQTNYEEYGGAAFLGCKAPVLKAHGSSNYIAIKNAIFQCYVAYKNQLTIEFEKIF